MSTVIALVSRVVINGVMHIHIIAWVLGKCLLHNPIEVICQYTVFPYSLWQLCICLIVLP